MFITSRWWNRANKKYLLPINDVQSDESYVTKNRC